MAFLLGEGEDDRSGWESEKGLSEWRVGIGGILIGEGRVGNPVGFEIEARGTQFWLQPHPLLSDHRTTVLKPPQAGLRPQLPRVRPVVTLGGGREVLGLVFQFD